MVSCRSKLPQEGAQILVGRSKDWLILRVCSAMARMIGSPPAPGARPRRGGGKDRDFVDVMTAASCSPSSPGPNSPPPGGKAHGCVGDRRHGGHAGVAAAAPFIVFGDGGPTGFFKETRIFARRADPLPVRDRRPGPVRPGHAQARRQARLGARRRADGRGAGRQRLQAPVPVLPPSRARRSRNGGADASRGPRVALGDLSGSTTRRP